MPTDDVRRWMGGIMDAIAVCANVGATLICIWATMHLWRTSSEYLTAAGGLPQLSFDYAWAAINAPALHLRVWFWFVAWACAVFAGGAALLSIAGLHWAWQRVRAAIRP